MAAPPPPPPASEEEEDPQVDDPDTEHDSVRPALDRSEGDAALSLDARSPRFGWIMWF